VLKVNLFNGPHAVDEGKEIEGTGLIANLRGLQGLLGLGDVSIEKEIKLLQSGLCFHKRLLYLKEGQVPETPKLTLRGLKTSRGLVHRGVVLVLIGQGNGRGNPNPKAVSLAKVLEAAYGDLKVWIVGLAGQGKGQVVFFQGSGLGQELRSSSERQLFQL